MIFSESLEANLSDSIIFSFPKWLDQIHQNSELINSICKLVRWVGTTHGDLSARPAYKKWVRWFLPN